MPGCISGRNNPDDAVFVKITVADHEQSEAGAGAGSANGPAGEPTLQVMPAGGTPEQLRDLLESEILRWSEVITRAKVPRQ